MRFFPAMLLRCVLVLGLGFTPVANALNMAAMAASQEEPPPATPPYITSITRMANVAMPPASAIAP